MRVRCWWFLRLILCAILPVSLAYAQHISGIVTDPTGAVIPGGSVQLAKDGRRLATAETDAAGKFALTVPSAGEERAHVYEISVSAGGFSTVTRRLQISGKQDINLPIRLRVAAANEEVAVYAASESLENQLAMGEVRDNSAKDLGEALSALDGVEKIRKGGIENDLVVRGLQQGNMNVLVDGIPHFRRLPWAHGPSGAARRFCRGRARRRPERSI